MASTLSEDLQGILDFVRQGDGFFPSSKCEIRPSELGGLGVYAQCNLKEGETILQLPKSCVFSASNSSIANLLFDCEVDGMLALIVAFIYETSVFKENSHWYPYLKSIKIADGNTLYLPPNLWDSRSKKLLKGSTLDTLHHGLDHEEEVEQGYELAFDLAKQWNIEFGLSIPEQYFSSFEQFVAVAYAISSRVFEIDNYHESALVPIADLFNHSVDCQGPHVRFVSLYDVCGECGEPGMCRHLIAEAALEREEEQPADGKQSSNSGVISMQLVQDLDDLDDEPHEEQEKGLVPNVHPDECVDIVVTRDVPKGQEIFNSYGELSNALLLARYGFCVKNNPWDIVYLGSDLLKLLKDPELKSRAKWWDDLGYKLYRNWYALNKGDDGNDEEDEEDEEDDVRESEGGSESDSEDDGRGSMQSWLPQMYLNHRGIPSPAMAAFLNLLNMNRKDWDKLRAIEQDVESQGHKIGILEKLNNHRSRKMLLRLVLTRKQKRNPLSAVKNPNARIMLQSEQHILYKAQKRLEKRISVKEVHH